MPVDPDNVDWYGLFRQEDMDNLWSWRSPFDSPRSFIEFILSYVEGLRVKAQDALFAAQVHADTLERETPKEREEEAQMAAERLPETRITVRAWHEFLGHVQQELNTNRVNYPITHAIESARDGLGDVQNAIRQAVRSDPREQVEREYINALQNAKAQVSECRIILASAERDVLKIRGLLKKYDKNPNYLFPPNRPSPTQSSAEELVARSGSAAPAFSRLRRFLDEADTEGRHRPFTPGRNRRGQAVAANLNLGSTLGSGTIAYDDSGGERGLDPSGESSSAGEGASPVDPANQSLRFASVPVYFDEDAGRPVVGRLSWDVETSGRGNDDPDF